MDLDEVDRVIYDLYEMTAEYGLSHRQAAAMLREKIDLAAQAIDDLLASDDWPEMISEAVH